MFLLVPFGKFFICHQSLLIFLQMFFPYSAFLSDFSCSHFCFINVLTFTFCFSVDKIRLHPPLLHNTICKKPMAPVTHIQCNKVCEREIIFTFKGFFMFKSYQLIQYYIKYIHVLAGIYGTIYLAIMTSFYYTLICWTVERPTFQ